MPLSFFFGYTAKGLFDLRVSYESGSQRWSMIADAFLESATVQYLFIVILQTSDYIGSFFSYQVNMVDSTFGANFFWDFPQVGADNNAMIFTAN